MPRYTVSLSASGDTEVEVEAGDRDGAIDRALAEVPGFIVAGGSVEWNVEDVRELDEADQ